MLHTRATYTQRVKQVTALFLTLPLVLFACSDTFESSADDYINNPGQTGQGVNEPKPLGPDGTWDLVFRDEFDGTSLDLTKWQPNWFGSDDTAISRPVHDSEVSCYDPAQVTVGNGHLYLLAVPADHPDCVTKDGTKAYYASGLISSIYRYHLTYGFVEARIFLPPGTGTPQNWPAFWLNGNNWPQNGEIDIMESLGGGVSTRWTYHYDADPGPAEDHREYTPGGNMIDESGWHVFGAFWQPHKITFYYDGVKVGAVTSNDLEGGALITDSPHYIIINLALNGEYPITVPSVMAVDYVRHWTYIPEPPKIKNRKIQTSQINSPAGSPSRGMASSTEQRCNSAN
jgi:beta-glucanase (GH16 family)